VIRRRDQKRRPARGFTLFELLVLIGIVLILLAIFIPYLLKIRESSRRVACARNLYVLLSGLQAYARDNSQMFPRVVHDEERMPDGYVAYTGPDGGDPFAAGSGVRANDVTASLWLLVRGGYVAPAAFLCPSSDGRRDPVAVRDGKVVDAANRGNFRGPRNLTYSYASPFGTASGFRLSSDMLASDFALMADMNPGTAGGDHVTAPAVDAPAFELARANSNNHGGAGQNVLYAAGYVEFKTTPYAGVERDHIYTALAPRPLVPPESPPASGRGVFEPTAAPAWNGDSFLVPSDDQTVASFAAVASTQPATTRATTEPATEPIEPATDPSTEPGRTPAATAPATTQPATTQAQPTVAATRPTTTTRQVSHP
jgi:type II secretory pathway pseudopilin PulG